MQLPGPVRAVVGLLANAADEAKHLPDRAVELPMLAVSTALQMSLRAQQRYARLAARGDEVLHRRPPTDEPPPWATFDAPVPIDELRTGTSAAAERASAASDLLDDLLGLTEGPTLPEDAPNGRREPVVRPVPDEPPSRPAAEPATSAAQPPAGKKAPAKKASPRTAAKKSAPATKAAAKKTTASKPKGVSKPRHTAPSRFDAVDDE